MKDGFYYLPTALGELAPVDVVFPNKGEVRDGQTDQSRGVGGRHEVTAPFPRDLWFAFPRQPETHAQNPTSQNVI